MPELMSNYKDRYIGRPAAVLGGGPSLPDDMKKLPNGCVLIAVNHHALLLCQPEFMVYNDPPGVSGPLEEAIRTAQVIKVSPEPTSDVKIDMEVWTGFYSSNLATWLALWLGCDPVILCGMDCYQGEKKYFHDYEDGPHLHYPLAHHISPWVEDAKNRLPGWERVKVMSGPLANIFGKYALPLGEEKRQYEKVFEQISG
ncbi:MAG: hypothetical protein A2136_05520 [Chloroflexi bacterium RBG_16_54_11]|nr:MAG: hypothetical protein A2136_05520 [Chloroflexi bacterium RBG_16_54_11]